MKDTPSMRQYSNMKQMYPDAILFFRMGDFYETFEDDAYIMSKVLDIALTSRDKGENKTPMAGIPHHALLAYLPKMLQAGYKVALCEQMEDPKTAKGVVRREVVKVISPGTVLDSEMQDPKITTYIFALHKKKEHGKTLFGIAIIDLTKGDFLVYETFDAQTIENIVENMHPAEIVVSEQMGKVPDLGMGYIKRFPVSYVPESDFSSSYVTEHFHVQNLKGFVSGKLSISLDAAGALLRYIETNEQKSIQSIEKIEEMHFGNQMYLDNATIVNLELFPYEKKNRSVSSLLDVLDETKTAMGARFLRYSLLSPLKDRDEIQQRLSAVDFLFQSDIKDTIASLLSEIGDIERINARVSFQSASPRDYLAIVSACPLLLHINNLLQKKTLPSLLQDVGIFDVKKITDIQTKIQTYIATDANTLQTGDVIASGVDTKLDDLKNLLHNGKGWIRQFQEKEIARTNISSLKVRYNKVFGYYIEISNTHKNKVPSEYVRKQTLVNGERYITQELKEKEDQILNAQDTVISIEKKIYEEFSREMLQYILAIKKICQQVATLDMLVSFARVAKNFNYVLPVISSDTIKKPIRIIDGRHPVIEQNMPALSYIPNDVYMDNTSSQILVITGPNMAGKSSVLRMCALISLMMQVGSFVPAKEAELAVVDRVFSRVGARDNLARGESTFMIEMSETANILHNATSDSLIVLDEIGRGTSTYDGVSIAYAVIEYIHENIGAKTMFATHYHELIDLDKIYKRVKNFNVLVQEEREEIIFLRKLVQGGTDKSYGIHVARLAGVPTQVIKRANNVLKEYEKIREEIQKADIPPLLSLLGAGDIPKEEVDDSLYQQLRDMIIKEDVDELTPMRALEILYLLQKMVQDD